MDLFTTAPAASASVSGPVVSSVGESDNLSGKVRSACDRCHSQKLRCVRNRGQVSCERCLKLKRSCRFGPRAIRATRASLKPAEQATFYGQGDRHGSLSVSASTPTPNVAMIADVNDRYWFSLPSADISIAEGRGQFRRACPRSNVVEITCLW